MGTRNKLMNWHLPEPEDKVLECFYCVKRERRIGDCQVTVTTGRQFPWRATSSLLSKRITVGNIVQEKQGEVFISWSKGRMVLILLL